ncbi:hypothetical protein VTI74DRAFT_6581 [Chaetomium olivicolor]
MATRIYENFETLACKETNHAALHRHYGPNIFKCTFPGCDLNRFGFPTRSARKSHVEIHARPWKCSMSSCPYATIGFATRRAQDDHSRKMHPEISQPWELESTALGCFTTDDVVNLLLELTKAGDVDQLECLCPRLGEKGWFVTRPAVLLAAKMGSLPMVKILNDHARIQGDNSEVTSFYRLLVKSENLELFRWLLDAICEWPRVHYYKVLAAEAFATKSPEMYAEWEDFLVDPSRQPKSAEHRSSLVRDQAHIYGVPIKLSVVFSTPAFSSVRKGALFEARLIQTWDRVSKVVGPLNPPFLGWSLTMLGRSPSYSITLGAELLKLGAPIDFPCGGARIIHAATTRGSSTDTDSDQQSEPGSQPRSGSVGGGLSLRPENIEHEKTIRFRYKGMTALHYASRGTSERAARFMRYLLEEGADPKYGFAGVNPAEEKGAKLMQKWLGESWEDVVARTEQARKRRKRLHGSDAWQYDQDEDEN